MWVQGEQKEIVMLALAISYEPKILRPRRLDQLMDQAIEAMYNEDYDRAEELLNEANTQYPNRPIVLQNLGALYQRRDGDYERAIEMSRRAVEIDPEYVMGRCQLALEAIVNQKDLEEAERWLSPILDKDEIHITEFELLCEAQVKLAHIRGRTEVARGWFQFWHELEPDSINLLRVRREVRTMRRL